MALLDSLRCDFVAHGDDLPIRTDGTGMYHESIAANRFRMIKRTEGVSTTTFIGRLLAATRSKTLEAGATNQANPGVMAASVSASATLLPTGSRLTSFADGLRPLSSAKRVVCKFARPLMSFSWPLLTDGWLTGASGMGRRRRHLGRFPCRARGVSAAGNCNYLPEALPPPPFFLNRGPLSFCTFSFVTAWVCRHERWEIICWWDCTQTRSRRRYTARGTQSWACTSA